MNTFIGRIFLYVRRYWYLRKFASSGKGIILWGKSLIVSGTKVSIGDRCTINNNVSLRSKFEPLKIGNNVTLSDFAYITTLGLNVDQFMRDKKSHIERAITIEDHVWVAARAVILSGVTIGHHSIIGAGAVVTKDIPPYSIATGIPARVIKSWKSTEGE